MKDATEQKLSQPAWMLAKVALVSLLKKILLRSYAPEAMVLKTGSGLTVLGQGTPGDQGNKDA